MGLEQPGVRELLDKRPCSGRRHDGCPVELVDEVCVPTVHRFGPYRFYFFIHENRETFERPHVHVRSGDGVAAFWLAPVSLRDHQRYNPREVERIRRIVVANRELLLRHWHDFFDQRP